MGKDEQPSIILLGAVITVLTAILLYIIGPNLVPHLDLDAETEIYFADRISPAHRLIIDRFNALHRGRIEVVPVDLPFEKFSTNERKELLARSLRSSNEKLDIFAVDLIWVSRFARWCEPLDPHVGPAERERIIPVARESCVRDSVLVAVPLYIDIGLMYYRGDLIDELPDGAAVTEDLRHSMSWQEFLRLRRRLGYEGRPFYLFQGDAYEGLVCNFLEFAVGLDPHFLDSNRIDLDRPAAREALQMMVDMIHRDKITPAAVQGWDETRSYDALLAGEGVFVRGWPNFVENYLARGGDTLRMGRIRKAALPHFPGEKPTSILGGWNLMVSKFSKKKPQALEFIRYLQTKEVQQLLYETAGFIPTSRAVYEDSLYMRAHPDLAYHYTLVSRGFHRPFLADYTRMSDILSHYLHLALSGELPVAEALRGAAARIQAKEVLIK
jgi:multiple sugar transport system substrate-binding protein